MTSATQQAREQTVALIQRAQTILILSHEQIDGDGLSSSIACFLLLKKMGKDVHLICADAIPESCQFLPGLEHVHHDCQHLKDYIVSVALENETEIDTVRYTIEDSKINIIISPKRGEIRPEHLSLKKNMNDFDLVICLDSPTKKSLGKVYEQNVDLFYNTPVVNIDHNVDNAYYGKVNLIDVTAASTTEVLMGLIPDLGGEALIDEDIATLLLTGIITDTMSFQNARTTPHAFHSASYLLKMGARQQEIIKSFYKTKKLSTLKLWGKVLAQVEHNPIVRLLWSSYSYRDLADFGASEKEINGIMDNLLGNAPGIEAVVLFYEKSPNETQVSFKTLTESLDKENLIGALPSDVIKHHGNGVTIRSSFDQAQKTVLDALSAYQQKRLGIDPEKLRNAISQDTPLLTEHTATDQKDDNNLPEVQLSDLTKRLEEGGE